MPSENVIYYRRGKAIKDKEGNITGYERGTQGQTYKRSTKNIISAEGSTPRKNETALLERRRQGLPKTKEEATTQRTNFINRQAKAQALNKELQQAGFIRDQTTTRQNAITSQQEKPKLEPNFYGGTQIDATPKKQSATSILDYKISEQENKALKKYTQQKSSWKEDLSVTGLQGLQLLTASKEGRLNKIFDIYSGAGIENPKLQTGRLSTAFALNIGSDVGFFGVKGQRLAQEFETVFKKAPSIKPAEAIDFGKQWRRDYVAVRSPQTQKLLQAQQPKASFWQLGKKGGYKISKTQMKIAKADISQTGKTKGLRPQTRNVGVKYQQSGKAYKDLQRQLTNPASYGNRAWRVKSGNQLIRPSEIPLPKPINPKKLELTITEGGNVLTNSQFYTNYQNILKQTGQRVEKVSIKGRVGEKLQRELSRELKNLGREEAQIQKMSRMASEGFQLETKKALSGKPARLTQEVQTAFNKLNKGASTTSKVLTSNVKQSIKVATGGQQEVSAMQKLDNQIVKAVKKQTIRPSTVAEVGEKSTTSTRYATKSRPQQYLENTGNKIKGILEPPKIKEPTSNLGQAFKMGTLAKIGADRIVTPSTIHVTTRMMGVTFRYELDRPTLQEQSPAVIGKTDNIVTQSTDTRTTNSNILQPEITIIQRSIVQEEEIKKKPNYKTTPRPRPPTVKLPTVPIIKPVIPRQPFRPRTPNIPALRIPKTPFPKMPLIPKINLSKPSPLRSAKFTAFAKVKGRWQPVGTGGKLKAFRLGRDFVFSRSSASFKVLDTSGNKITGFNLGDRLRRSKKDKGVFVEKNKYRINTGGELSEITFSTRKWFKGGLFK